MNFEVNQSAQSYLRVWRSVLVGFLGRSESEFEEFVEKWRDDLARGHSIFYHETPEYYIAPFLLPKALPETLTVHDRSRLCWTIYPVIGRYDREHRLAPECFASLRGELDRTIANWLAANVKGQL